MSKQHICQTCGDPIKPGQGGLSTRVHSWCRPAKRVERVKAAVAPAKLTRVVNRHGVTNPRVIGEKGNVRNRGLLDLAHEITTCMNCGAHVEHGCEPAHANAGMTPSKGLSVKASDAEHAALCPSCHRWLDQGGSDWDPSGRYLVTREERREMWTAAYFKTQAEYWKRGYIVVKGRA